MKWSFFLGQTYKEAERKGLRTLTAPDPGDELDAISAPKTAMKSEGFVVGWEKGSREGE